VNAACEHLRAQGIVRLAQALPEPAEGWAIDALAGASFVRVGELAYLRRPLPGRQPGAVEGAWPPGVTVRNVGMIGDAAAPGPDRGVLIEAMDRSYINTLDCPELCGLRDTSDVLDSHRATGQWHPDLWWVMHLNGQAAGCLLLSHCPDQSSVELVYLGLAPELRGRGLARRLLSNALPRLTGLGATHIACAVDTRNAPALKLYESFGFVEVTSRLGMVRPLHRGR
jgi:ribosomal protein S18 acetylase RimI-like enzyme